MQPALTHIDAGSSPWHNTEVTVLGNYLKRNYLNTLSAEKMFPDWFCAIRLHNWHWQTTDNAIPNFNDYSMVLQLAAVTVYSI